MLGKGAGHDPARATNDHILPQEWGGSDHGQPGLGYRLVVRGTLQPANRNLVTICSRCNARRASCLHCWALVACVDVVAKDTGEPFKRIYRLWNIGLVRAAMPWRRSGV
jgi:hypothetical protein